MADKSNDPVAIWQNMIGEMEKGFNSFANQAMASPEFSKVVNQVGGVTAGAQKQLGELMEKYLRQHEPAEPGADGRHGRAAAVDRRPAQRDQGAAASGAQQLAGAGQRNPARRSRRAPSVRHRQRRAKMNAPAAGLDLASIPERIQSEVQRAIQRSIKGVEYIASSGPVARLDAEGHPGTSAAP